MKKTIMLLVLVLTFSAALLYAGSGDLIVTDKLGVGKTNPNYPIDVVGDVNITGSYKINGVNQPVPTLTGAISGLSIANDATYPNTKINLTAKLIGIVVPSGTIGIDCTASGQAAGNDLDTGTLQADMHYYIWAIYKGTTIAGLASTSSSSPNMPSNFTGGAIRLIGAVYTDGSAHFIKQHQYGNQVFYDVREGDTFTNHPNYTQLSLSSCGVPPNAVAVTIDAEQGSSPSGASFISIDGTNSYFKVGGGAIVVSLAGTIQLLTPQSIWYKIGTSATLGIYVTGYILNL